MSRAATKEKTELLGDSSRVYIPGVNALGPLEKTIMEYMWGHEGGTVPEVHKWLRKQGKDLAYNTVMTVTTRLAQKGYLAQDKSSIMFVYTPKMSYDEYREGLLNRIMDKVTEIDPDAVIKYTARSNN